MGFLQQEYWSGLPFSPPVDRVLSELFTLTCSSWVPLQGVAFRSIELCKSLCHDKAMIHEGITVLSRSVVSDSLQPRGL